MFTSADGEIAMSFHAVSRGGRPFLFLPSFSKAAVKALEIYPAQTVKARFAKAALGMMLRLGLRVGLQETKLAISSADPFASFLRTAARVEPSEAFSFAVLSGNPHAPGRRHIFLLFNSASKPVSVVKAGVTDRARELIAHEASLLSAFDSAQSGLPRLRGACELANLSAFAIDFIEGASPVDDVGGELEKIFSSWADISKQVELCETAAWGRLIQAHGSRELPSIYKGLQNLRLHPVLMHGDFAPWNVKVSAGQWTVLDWERGERVGIPAWDWLHFVVQPAVLVRREPVDATVARLEKLFRSVEFQRYAARCGIVGTEWKLAFAYVDYCINVTSQTEGLELLEVLRAALQVRQVTE
jgi:hypothetical protein